MLPSTDITLREQNENLWRLVEKQRALIFSLRSQLQSRLVVPLRPILDSPKKVSFAQDTVVHLVDTEFIVPPRRQSSVRLIK